MSGASIRVEGVRKSFGRHPVLDAVSLDVREGGCTALLGPSGCGKTTLLRIVAGLERADAGRVEIGGTVTDGPEPRVPPEQRGVALVFQDQALWPHMSVAGNLGFVLEARGVARGERAARGAELAGSVGLPARLLERRPGELSGGERQRAALARALAQEPRVLLLDEPLSGLDRHLRLHLTSTLRHIRAERGLTMLVVTHDREEAFALADRVAVLRDGRVEQEGAPDEIYAAPQSRFVAEFVGAANVVPAGRDGDGVTTALGAWPAHGAVPAAAGPLLAVFRPESLRLAPTVDGNAVVRDAFYRGDHWMMEVEVLAHGTAPETTHVLVRGPAEIAPGTRVTIQADPPALVPGAEGSR